MRSGRYCKVLLLLAIVASGCSPGSTPSGSDLLPFPMPRPSANIPSPPTPQGCWKMSSGLNAIGGYLSITDEGGGSFLGDQSGEIGFGSGYFPDNLVLHSTGDPLVFEGDWALYLPPNSVPFGRSPVTFVLSSDGQTMTFSVMGQQGRVYSRVDCSTLP